MSDEKESASFEENDAENSESILLIDDHEEVVSEGVARFVAEEFICFPIC